MSPATGSPAAARSGWFKRDRMNESTSGCFSDVSSLDQVDSAMHARFVAQCGEAQFAWPKEELNSRLGHAAQKQLREARRLQNARSIAQLEVYVTYC